MATTGAVAADEEQIRAVIAGRAAAMHDRDAERFVACYAPQITKFDLAPPLAHQGPEARDAKAAAGLVCQPPGRTRRLRDPRPSGHHRR